MKVLVSNTAGMEQALTEKIVRGALREDLGGGDVTTQWVLRPGQLGEGRLVAHTNGVVAGLGVAGAVFGLLDRASTWAPSAHDGEEVPPGRLLATVRGRARSILSGERTALNFLTRMSGIATLTRRFVNAVAGTKAIITDTRKTAPGLRLLDKMAVRAGGGKNHRMGLYDMVLIKENHIAAAGGLAEAVARVKAKNRPGLLVEVEIKALEELREALDLKVDRIMLDDMTVEEMRRAVEVAGGHVPLEASGGVTLENVGGVAATGVDYISIGALTHSAPALDISLEFIRLDGSRGRKSKAQSG